MKTFKTILFWSLLALVLIQFIPVNRTNLPVKTQENFVDVFATPKNVQNLLRNACYDCHSNETEYPSYSYIAPISWSVKNHIDEGREHLNYSIWQTYNRDLKKNMLEKSISSIQNYSMPMPGYIAQHPEANLTAAERKLLINYFEKILNSGKY